jgi:hypothetical protein
LVPVGASSQLAHKIGVAGQWRAEVLEGIGIPQLHRAGVAASGEAVPIGAKRHTSQSVASLGAKEFAGIALRTFARCVPTDGWVGGGDRRASLSDSVAVARRNDTGGAGVVGMAGGEPRPLQNGSPVGPIDGAAVSVGSVRRGVAAEPLRPGPRASAPSTTASPRRFTIT